MAERKILIVTNRVPFPLKDGGNMAMHAMVEGYRRAGWQVSLLAMNTKRHHVPSAQLKTLYTDIHSFEWMDFDNTVSNKQIIRNFLFSKEPEHTERFYKPEFEQKLISMIREIQPDFVQIESVYLTTYLPAIKRETKALTVLRMHNIEYQIWFGVARKSRNAIKRFYLTNLSERVRNYERKAWRLYDLLVPITERDANQVTMLENANAMIVAPFSIDVDSVRVSSGNEKWVGYHIGAMDWIANRDAIRWFLDEIWPKLHKAVPGFEFFFAGRNMPDSFMRDQPPGTHCMDEVASADDFIADKKILIVPLRSGGGIRVKILEAMASGKVIIATPVAIKGIEAKQGEHYMLVRRPHDFVKAINWCLENRDAAQEMADRARRLIREKYDHAGVIGSVVNELERLYNRRMM